MRVSFGKQLMKMISGFSPFQNDKDEFQTIIRLYVYIATSGMP
jgi:hypothetical protein